MSLDSLRRRIGRLRNELQGSTDGRRGHAGPGPEFPGWDRCGEYVYERRTRTALDLPGDFPGLTEFGYPSGDFIYFDLETTGLSGGAGTTIFLAGIGRNSGGQLEIKQYFSSDFPGEPELLEIVWNEIGDDSVLVSYNGKAFDYSLLKTKSLMSAVKPRDVRHADLLYISRRLWKRELENCSLAAVEAAVLGCRRENDVSGFEIPAIYFDFVRRKDYRIIAPVFLHHFRDIENLAGLACRIDSILREPSRAAKLDRLGLGLLCADRRHDAAYVILDELYNEGNPAAGRELARLYKRQKRFSEAVPIWTSLWERDGSVSSAVELAKYYEHVARDYKRAIEIVDTVLRKAGWRAEHVPAAGKDDLQRRMRRLQSKSKKRLRQADRGL